MEQSSFSRSVGTAHSTNKPTVFALMGMTRVVILEMRDTMVVHSILPFSRESGGEGK